MKFNPNEPDYSSLIKVSFLFENLIGEINMTVLSSKWKEVFFLVLDEINVMIPSGYWVSNTFEK